MNFEFIEVVDGWYASQVGSYHWCESDEEKKSALLVMYFGNGLSSNYCSNFGNGMFSGIVYLFGNASDNFFMGNIGFDVSGYIMLLFNVYLDVWLVVIVDMLIVRLDDLNGDQNVVWIKVQISVKDYEKWIPVTIDVIQYVFFIGLVWVVFDMVIKDLGGEDGDCCDVGKGVFVDDVIVI